MDWPNLVHSFARCHRTPAPAASAADAAIANLAFAQAAATLGPAITQLAAATLQQQQQSKIEATPSPTSSDFANQLKMAFEQSKKAHDARSPEMLSGTLSAPQARSAQNVLLASRATRPSLTRPPSDFPSAAPPRKPPMGNTATTAPSLQSSIRDKETQAPPLREGGTIAPNPRSEEDKQAGSILFGFLSSLRQSYEDALLEKEKLGEGISSRVSREAEAPVLPRGGQQGRDAPKDDGSGHREGLKEEFGGCRWKKRRPSTAHHGVAAAADIRIERVFGPR